jgi:hypothetical protein
VAKRVRREDGELTEIDARWDADIIDAHDEDKREAIYQFLSENDDKAVHMKTDEERLQQLVNFLKLAFERDVRNNKLKERKPEEHEELRIKYPDYWERLAKINEEFIGINAGYRRLTCMPTFMLGLVMASRIRRHYVHASWFRVTSFNKMLEVHGGVSTRYYATS